MQAASSTTSPRTRLVARRSLLARLTVLAAAGYVAPQALRIAPALANHQGGGDGHSQPPGRGPPSPGP